MWWWLTCVCEYEFKNHTHTHGSFYPLLLDDGKEGEPLLSQGLLRAVFLTVNLQYTCAACFSLEFPCSIAIDVKRKRSRLLCLIYKSTQHHNRIHSNKAIKCENYERKRVLLTLSTGFIPRSRRWEKRIAKMMPFMRIIPTRMDFYVIHNMYWTGTWLGPKKIKPRYSWRYILQGSFSNQ